jgi:hypothetical protein
VRWIFLTLLLLNSLFAAVEWSAKIDASGVLNKSYQIIQGGDRLGLLRELGSQVDAGKVTASKGGVDRLCMLLGPMVDKAKALQLINVFKLRSVDVELVAQGITKAPNYWVYLAPFESRKAAVKKLKEMQGAKVDSYLITQGDLANGISLGVFENIDSARRMSGRRRNQGYDVKITELGKKEYEYWVAIMKEYTEELDAEVSEIMNELELLFEKRQIYCKSVASEKQLP